MASAAKHQHLDTSIYLWRWRLELEQNCATYDLQTSWLALLPGLAAEYPDAWAPVDWLNWLTVQLVSWFGATPGLHDMGIGHQPLTPGCQTADPLVVS